MVHPHWCFCLSRSLEPLSGQCDSVNYTAAVVPLHLNAFRAFWAAVCQHETWFHSRLHEGFSLCNTHPSHSLSTLLPSGKHYSSFFCRTDRWRGSFSLQAVRLRSSPSIRHNNVAICCPMLCCKVTIKLTFKPFIEHLNPQILSANTFSLNAHAG